MDELAGFPGGAHDDIVDALSQGLNYLASRYTFGDALAPVFYEGDAGTRTYDEDDPNYIPPRRGLF
jgi:hypothetical protein